MKSKVRVSEPSPEVQFKIRKARTAIASQKRRMVECPYCHHNAIVVFEDTESFRKLLRANELREIRFHDLRHSCASLMLANGVPMKQIQDWLGHSDFSTTANIYAHLDYNSKISSADAMLNGLGLAVQ